tara:strand:+ start:5078 stop:5680 length:603 start_codon:yes stop_codon:yes gene_type:complete
MKKDTKIVLAVLVAGGGLLLTRYFLRQYRLLRNVCVSNTNLNWAPELVQLAIDATDGNGFSLNTLDTPFELELSNSSDIPVTVKDINLNVYLEGQKIGKIIDVESTTLDKNSSVTLFLNLDIDEDIIAGVVQNTALQTALEYLTSIFSNDVDTPTTQIEVSGVINVKASIYESFKIRYRLVTTPSGLIEESSGNCEPIKS